MCSQSVKHISQYFQSLFNAHHTTLSLEQLVCYKFTQNSHIRCHCSQRQTQFNEIQSLAQCIKKLFLLMTFSYFHHVWLHFLVFRAHIKQTIYGKLKKNYLIFLKGDVTASKNMLFIPNKIFFFFCDSLLFIVFWVVTTMHHVEHGHLIVKINRREETTSMRRLYSKRSINNWYLRQNEGSVLRCLQTTWTKHTAVPDVTSRSVPMYSRINN